MITTQSSSFKPGTGDFFARSKPGIAVLPGILDELLDRPYFPGTAHHAWMQPDRHHAGSLAPYRQYQPTGRLPQVRSKNSIARRMCSLEPLPMRNLCRFRGGQSCFSSWVNSAPASTLAITSPISIARLGVRRNGGRRFKARSRITVGVNVGGNFAGMKKPNLFRSG